MNGGFLQLVSQSAFTGVTVSDIHSHLNITDTSQDSYIQALINAAVVYCERELQLDLRLTNWNLILEQFPIWGSYNWMDRWGNYVYTYPWVSEFAIGRVTQKWQEIPLRRGPVTAVNSITYFDTNNTTQSLTVGTDYQYATWSYQPGTVEPVSFWPVSFPRPDAVTINFSTCLTPLPASLAHAVKLMVGKWWYEREAQAYGPNTVSRSTEEAVDCLLGQYRAVQYV